MTMMMLMVYVIHNAFDVWLVRSDGSHSISCTPHQKYSIIALHFTSIIIVRAHAIPTSINKTQSSAIHERSALKLRIMLCVAVCISSAHICSQFELNDA